MANKFGSNLKDNLSIADENMGVKIDTLKEELENLSKTEFFFWKWNSKFLSLLLQNVSIKWPTLVFYKFYID